MYSTTARGGVNTEILDINTLREVLAMEEDNRERCPRLEELIQDLLEGVADSLLRGLGDGEKTEPPPIELYYTFRDNCGAKSGRRGIEDSSAPTSSPRPPGSPFARRAFFYPLLISVVILLQRSV